jgi:hypothetical protein
MTDEPETSDPDEQTLDEPEPALDGDESEHPEVTTGE